jgi:uncharacterized protein (DUF2141 family)
MRSFTCTLALCLALGGQALRSEETPPGPKSDIEVTAIELRNTKGSVIFCLWRASDPSFPKPDQGKPFLKQASTAVEAKTVFKDVPSGSYAISVLHDESGTGRIETNAMGMPRSGIGLSNGFSLPPSFSKARFSVPVEKPVQIKVNYF